MIYLVLNCIDKTEPFVINICTTLNKALNLRDNYIKNSEFSSDEHPERIFRVLILDESEAEEGLLWDYELNNGLY